MLVLPIEKRFDWKYPPVMLFTIVVVNLAVFFLYQSADEEKISQALQRYYDHDLLRMEWPAYQAYLEATDSELLGESREQYRARQIEPIVFAMVMDDGFQVYLDEHPEALVFDPAKASDNWHDWSLQRKLVRDRFHSVSWLSLGLTPSQLRPATLITHQFLHGDSMHLLFNMLFLVISGFAVEAAIGAGLFLVLYLASGVAGGLAFALLDLSSDRPLIGASAAISGVMAMYLAVFRLRRIEFFYWIFVFVGFFRAPALVILPFYIGKELVDFTLNPDSQVAFMAHAGGFVAGASLVSLAYWLRPQMIDRHYIEQDQDADPRRQAMAEVYRLLDDLRLAAALSKLEVFIAEYGLDFELALLRYNLRRAMGDPACDRDFLQLIARRPRCDREIDKLAKAWVEGRGFHPPLDEPRLIKLGLNLSTVEHVSLAEAIFLGLYHPQRPNSGIGVLARKLSVVFGKLGAPEKQEHYQIISEACITGTA